MVLLDAHYGNRTFIFSGSQESIDKSCWTMNNKGTRRVVFCLILWTYLSLHSIVPYHRSQFPKDESAELKLANDVLLGAGQSSTPRLCPP
jgi:hypothetical protein